MPAGSIQLNDMSMNGKHLNLFKYDVFYNLPFFVSTFKSVKSINICLNFTSRIEK